MVFHYARDCVDFVLKGEGEGDVTLAELANRVLARYDALHNWRKARAKTRGVESDVIVAREALWEIAINNPAAEADLDAVVEMGPWRRAAYASELLGVVQRANNDPQ